jgi:hypothetical protein
MLALRLAEEAARRREAAGGIVCPWEVDTVCGNGNDVTTSERVSKISGESH